MPTMEHPTEPAWSELDSTSTTDRRQRSSLFVLKVPQSQSTPANVSSLITSIPGVLLLTSMRRPQFTLALNSASTPQILALVSEKFCGAGGGIIIGGWLRALNPDSLQRPGEEINTISAQLALFDEIKTRKDDEMKAWRFIFPAS